MEASVDNESIEIDQLNKMKVKDRGITNDMLEGNINLETKVTGILSIDSLPYKNENNMISNSSFHVPTQSSVKEYIETHITDLINTSPGTLNTLNELASALGDDANFSVTMT